MSIINRAVFTTDKITVTVPAVKTFNTWAEKYTPSTMQTLIKADGIQCLLNESDSFTGEYNLSNEDRNSLAELKFQMDKLLSDASNILLQSMNKDKTAEKLRNRGF